MVRGAGRLDGGAVAMTCEVSWFAALCDDDYEFLGVPDPKLASSWEHCRDIAVQADTLGFDNILLPSGYALGIDTTAFAAGIAPMLQRLALVDGGADRRGLAAPAGAPDRHDRPDAGRAADDQHHLVRPARPDARVRTALRPHGGGDGDPQDAAQWPAAGPSTASTTRSRSTRRASPPCPAARPCSTSAACRSRRARRRRRGATCS